MNQYTAKQVALSMLLACASLPALAEDEKHYLSVVPRAGSVVNTGLKKTVIPPRSGIKGAPAAKAGGSQAASSGGAANGASGSAAAGNGAATGDMPAAEAPPQRSFYSAELEHAVSQYRSGPTPQAFSQILTALKNTLIAAGGGLRLSPAILVKDNPYLADFKPKVTEAKGVRLWSFPKAPDRSRILVQWYDVHQQVIGTGRRKRVVSSSAMHLQELSFSQPLNVKDAGIVFMNLKSDPASAASGARESASGRHLLLSADADDGSLLLQAYKMGEGGWVSSPEFLAQIPAFLTSNVTGRIAFRGSDLIYNVGKMIQTTDSNGTTRFLPEAESATYKFWLKSTDNGYVVAPAVADEEAFAGVYQFMQAVQQSRSDVERTLLVDDRLASLPKYLGLQGKALDSSVRVVEMSVPPARGQRFRLINLGKDDLIFDVGKIRGAWQVKAIFIAPPDAFLTETARYFPLYSSFVQKNEPKPEADKADSSPAAKK